MKRLFKWLFYYDISHATKHIIVSGYKDLTNEILMRQKELSKLKTQREYQEYVYGHIIFSKGN
jgi:hypothetical protein